MSPAKLKASRLLWLRREKYRKAKHTAALKGHDTAAVTKWGRLLNEARQMVARRDRQLAALGGAKPRIITANQLGLRFQNLFGGLGPELHVTGHYSAGGRAHTASQGIAFARSFHAQHAAKGWGGCGYHYMIPDDGSLICVRPTHLKGAHVGGHNSNNIGVNMPGTTGDEPTSAQRATYRWLLRNAHTRAMPAAHRTAKDLRNAKRHGHNSWDGHQSNGCPGKFKPIFLAGG